MPASSPDAGSVDPVKGPDMGFIRTEPAAVTAAVVAILTFVVALGVDLPAEAQTATAAAVPILMGAVLAATVRPVKVPVVVAGVVELFVLAAAWGADLPGPDDAAFVVALSAMLTALGALVVRSQVIPAGGVVDREVVNAGRVTGGAA